LTVLETGFALSCDILDDACDYLHIRLDVDLERHAIALAVNNYMDPDHGSEGGGLATIPNHL